MPILVQAYKHCSEPRAAAKSTCSLAVLLSLNHYSSYHKSLRNRHSHSHHNHRPPNLSNCHPRNNDRNQKPPHSQTQPKYTSQPQQLPLSATLEGSQPQQPQPQPQPQPPLQPPQPAQPQITPSHLSTPQDGTDPKASSMQDSIELCLRRWLATCCPHAAGHTRLGPPRFGGRPPCPPRAARAWPTPP